MKKDTFIYRITLFLFLSLAPLATILAQQAKKNASLELTVCSSEDNEPLMNVAMQLYSLPDTLFVSGAASDVQGVIRHSTASGNYLMRLSYVGYITQEKNITLEVGKPLNLGKVMLTSDIVALKQAVITAEAPPITMVEDTMIYNTSAFRVPAGSMLEELIKKYPGVEIADDGTITINGKTVNRILMKGKDFFGDDKEVALKNIPVDVVDKVKFYDKQSDYSRITGIDDGEEETVLDLQMKKGADRGFFGNADAGYGTKNRYTGKGLANYFTDTQQYTLLLSANNVGDRGFSRGGGGGGGLQSPKNAGFNFATSSAKLETGGHINFRHNDTDRRSYSSTEYFMSGNNSGQYVNDNSISLGRTMRLNGRFRLEWKPDSMTNIIFSPSLSYNTSDSWSKSLSATFDSDPFTQGYDYSFEEFGDVPDALSSIAINRNSNESLGKNENRMASANLQINRRLNNRGRNIALNGGFSYGDSKSRNFSINNVHFYRSSAGEGYERKRYTTTPGVNWSYNARLSYTEPIVKNLFLQLSYRFNYSYQNSNRSTYVLDNLPDYTPEMSGNYIFPQLPESYEEYYSETLSRFSTYRNMRHDAQMMFRYVTSKMNLSAGVSFQPQQTNMSYKYNGLDTILKRTVYNVTPNVRMRYKWNKTTTLNVVYRGSASQPSMTDLLDVTDDSNPLEIRKGNPGLKPSFTHRFDARFNTNNPDKQQGIMANIRYTNTLNSISQKVIYDEVTGGRTIQPENINGNWNLNGGFSFNSAIPANKKFTYSTSTNAQYNNQVSYISIDRNSGSSKNTNRALSLGEQLRFGYRCDIFDITLNGRLNYTHSDNKLQPDRNMDTYQFSYGPSGNVNIPWQNMQISTDISMSSRRGFNDPEFNTNELLWNAQISLSALDNNALTITFQVYDILQQQSNVSRTINALMRRDSQTNAINSYCMLHLIYKFNQMGGDDARQKVRVGAPRYGGFGNRPTRGRF